MGATEGAVPLAGAGTISSWGSTGGEPRRLTTDPAYDGAPFKKPPAAVSDPVDRPPPGAGPPTDEVTMARKPRNRAADRPHPAPDRLLLPLFFLLFTVFLLVILAPALARAQDVNPGPGDWGDAPEGALAYPSLGVAGQFPTCFGGPAGFIWHGNPGRAVDLYWGFDVDDEIDGNAGFCPAPPYEMDECWGPFDGDGGLAIPDTYTIGVGNVVVPCGQQPPRPLGFTCQVLNLTVGGPFEANIVNNSGAPGFVNVAFDWNQDGTWGGQVMCGALVPEHAIVNLPVPPFYVGPLSGLSPGPVQIGPNAGYVWIRMTLSNQPVSAGWDGSGLFDLGETEDYLIEVLDQPAQGELGDAPEGAFAYPGVLGQFPTCVAGGPAGYVFHQAPNSAYFGPSVDFEFEGNANVCPPPAYDQDECNGGGGDGGILFPMPLTLDPGATSTTCPNGAVGPSLVGCLTARWGADIDIDVTNNSPDVRYVSVLADWDGNGEWDLAPGGACPNGVSPSEQVLLNHPVPSGHSGPLSTLLPPDFTVGTPADGMSWFRFSVTDAPVGPAWTGDGLFGDGETEDYLFRIAQPPVDAPELGALGAGGGLRFDSVRPNPMSESAVLRLVTPRSGPVDVRVYDAAGRKVVTLESGRREAGVHSFPWDGRDASGRAASPGVYFVRAEQQGEAATVKVVRIR